MDDLAWKTFVKCAKLAKNGILRNTSELLQLMLQLAFVPSMIHRWLIFFIFKMLLKVPLEKMNRGRNFLGR